MAIPNNNQSEEQLQAQCYQWFHNTFPALRGLLFHIPNGGKRSMREGAKFKAMGVIPGVSDLLLLVPIPSHISFRCNGLFIEMKAEGEDLSPAQKKLHPIHRAAGYEVLMCDNFIDFQNIVLSWLKLSQYAYLTAA